MKARKIQVAGFVFLLGMLVFSIPGCGKAADKPDAGDIGENGAITKAADDGVSQDPETANADSTDELAESEVIVEGVGIGGGAGAHFGGRRGGKRMLRAGGGGRIAPVVGGTDIPNEEPYDAQFFKNYGVNPFVDVEDDALSTFAADVDTGAYTICRKFINDGKIPEKDAVRVEEFVNYFDYSYDPPFSGAFSARVEGAPSPFAGNRYMMAIGLKGMVVDPAARKDAVLTFVVDVSGSMNRGNRLGLVKQALHLLLDRLRPTDLVGIAIYGSAGKKFLDHTSVGSGVSTIKGAIDSLASEGSTNAGEGIKIGYEMAARAFRAGCINRVILCSDGVANVGRTSSDTIYEVIKENVKKGIDLTTVGFGMDNYNDVLMEQLGKRGNGFYSYVDDIKEAERVFVEGLSGTLQVIARDVKIQVEFNPEVVRSYRLVGYENRAVADEDFRNDVVDGGEVGAGHSVTAVYELKFWDNARPSGTVGWFRVRYKNPDYVSDVREFEQAIAGADFRDSVYSASSDYRLAACAAYYAEVLRKSYWAKDVSLQGAKDEANSLAETFPENEKIVELKDLITGAEGLLAVEVEKKKALDE